MKVIGNEKLKMGELLSRLTSINIFRRFFHFRAILFGVALLYYVSTYVWWKRLIGDNYPPEHGSPLTDPFYILVAAALLLINRSWSYLLVLAICGLLAYHTAYDTLLGCAAAYDVTPFNGTALRCWWRIFTRDDVRLLINLLISLLFVTYSVVRLLCNHIYPYLSRRNELHKKVETRLPA